MIIQTTLVVLMVIGFGGVAIGIIGLIYEYIQNKSISNLKVEDLTIPKSKFVQLVNDWCYTNIKSTNPQPTIEVKYYANKKNSGVYYTNGNSMVVYIHKTSQLIDIVNTVIHEYIHSTQKTKGFDRLYNQYTKEKGYWDNPYEVECREGSEKYQYQCLQDLITNNNILK
jgi:hypothetical protein